MEKMMLLDDASIQMDRYVILFWFGVGWLSTRTVRSELRLRPRQSGNSEYCGRLFASVDISGADEQSR